MPYDLLVTVLLVALSLSVVLYLVITKRKSRITIYKVCGSIGLLIVVSASIVTIGHSTWNRNIQLEHMLTNSNTIRNVSWDSDKEAVKEIATNQEPTKIHILSEQQIDGNNADKFYEEIVDVNNKEYKIKMACYVYPLTWTPYETWKIIYISRLNK